MEGTNWPLLLRRPVLQLTYGMAASGCFGRLLEDRLSARPFCLLCCLHPWAPRGTEGDRLHAIGLSVPQCISFPVVLGKAPGRPSLAQIKSCVLALSQSQWRIWTGITCSSPEQREIEELHSFEPHGVKKRDWVPERESGSSNQQRERTWWIRGKLSRTQSSRCFPELHIDWLYVTNAGFQVSSVAWL